MMKTTAATMMASLLLFGCKSPPATPVAAADQRVTPVEGMYYSVHSAPIGDCPAIDWHVSVGPFNSLSGMASTQGMTEIWQLTGSLSGNGDHKFHLDGKELSGPHRKGTVDGQVQPDGSLVMTLGNLSAPSPCSNKTIFVPVFHTSSPYEMHGGGPGY